MYVSGSHASAELPRAVRKYLNTHAEIDARRLYERLGEARYNTALQVIRAVIVPAYAEPPAFLARLEIEPGSLLVVVVNSPSDVASQVRRENEALERELQSRYGRGESLGPRLTLHASSSSESQALLVDATELPPAVFARQGVGLARKLGNDVALALWARGRIRSPWLQQADADVTLPPDLSARAETFGSRPSPGALVYPFRHTAMGDQQVDQATFRVEAKLRYQVLGLRWARSPYAWHSIGSCIAVRAETYAAVHGMPKRSAGEDYHLLCKVQKVAGVATLSGEPIAIRARRSRRTPFGTGSSVHALLMGERFLLECPQSFAALRRWIARLRTFVRSAEPRDLRPAGELPMDHAAWGVLVGFGAMSVLPELAQQTKDPSDRCRRVFAWFDGLKAQRLLHALRERGYPQVPARHALRRAPFTAAAFRALSDEDFGDWEQVCRGLEDLEALPAAGSSTASREAP